jgi:hypothetical protein
MFWFLALITAREASNATYFEHIKTTQHMLVFCRSKNLFKCQEFGCLQFMTLCKVRQGQVKLVTRALEGINLGYATDSNIS